MISHVRNAVEMKTLLTLISLILLFLCAAGSRHFAAQADLPATRPATRGSATRASTLADLRHLITLAAEGQQSGHKVLDESPAFRESVVAALTDEASDIEQRELAWETVLLGATSDTVLWLPLLEAESEGRMTNGSFSVATSHKYKSDVLQRAAFLILTNRKYKNSIRLGATLYLTYYPPSSATEFISGRMKTVLADEGEDAGITFAAIKVASSLKDRALNSAILDAINRLPFDENTLKGFRETYIVH